MAFIFFWLTLTLTSEHDYLCIILGSGNNWIYRIIWRFLGVMGALGVEQMNVWRGKAWLLFHLQPRRLERQETLLGGIPQGSARFHKVTRICSNRLCLLCVLCLWCIRFLVPVLHFIHAICPVICSFNAVWNLLSCSWMLDSVMCLSLANGMRTEVTGPGLKTPCLFCSIHFSSTVTIRMTCPG